MSQRIQIIKKEVYWNKKLVHQNFRFKIDGDTIETFSSKKRRDLF
jgi:hypothetical protein